MIPPKVTPLSPSVEQAKIHKYFKCYFCNKLIEASELIQQDFFPLDFQAVCNKCKNKKRKRNRIKKLWEYCCLSKCCYEELN